MKIPKQGYVIAIDGPAASGKTTVTKLLAKRLGFNYIDTGALYRAVAFLLWKHQKGQPLETSQEMIEKAESIARTTHFEFKGDRLWANGIDISDMLRSLEISSLSSSISTFAGVRASLLSLQRRLGCQGNSILEGRDIGTIIFPDADVKIFLVASLQQRSERRFLQIQSQNNGLTVYDIQDQLLQRDQQDMQRTHAPLAQAKDAILVDTSELSLEEVVFSLEQLIHSRMAPQ